MQRFGIRGLATSHLRDRTHRVRIGRTVSGWLTINNGVPQGSLLGPILFLIFKNDLVNLSRDFQPILYADDTTLLFSDHNSQNFVSQRNSGSTIFHNWSISNKLSTNEEKTCCMTITSRSLKCYKQIRLNSEILEFENHCNISKLIGVLYRIGDSVPRSVLINLYNTLILPYSTYCVSIWGGTCDTHADQIIKLQKRASRVTRNEFFREQTNDFFHCLQYSQIKRNL